MYIPPYDEDDPKKTEEVQNFTPTLYSIIDGFPAKLKKLKIKETAEIKPVMIKIDDLKSETSVASRSEVVVHNIPELHHAQLPDVRVQRELSMPIKGVPKRIDAFPETSITDKSHGVMDEGNAEFFFISIGQASLKESATKRYACLNFYNVSQLRFC